MPNINVFITDEMKVGEVGAYEKVNYIFREDVYCVTCLGFVTVFIRPKVSKFIRNKIRIKYRKFRSETYL